MSPSNTTIPSVSFCQTVLITAVVGVFSLSALGLPTNAQANDGLVIDVSQAQTPASALEATFTPSKMSTAESSSAQIRSLPHESMLPSTASSASGKTTPASPV